MWKYTLTLTTAPNWSISILRQAKYFDSNKVEIPINPSVANYRTILNPSYDVDAELAKITADGAVLDSQLQYVIDNKIKPMLVNYWWDSEAVEQYLQSEDGISNPEGVTGA